MKPEQTADRLEEVAATASEPVGEGVSPRKRGWMVAVVLASLIFGLAVIAFRAALEATPYATEDSVGRPMGFNDPLHSEHHAIIWSHASPGRTLTFMGGYDWAFVAVHLAAVALLLGSVRRGRVCGFLAVQPLLFPLGIPGVILLFADVWALMTGSLRDREHYIDVPYVYLVAHGAWLLAAGGLALRLGRRGSRARS